MSRLCGFHPFDPDGTRSDNEMIAAIKTCAFDFEDEVSLFLYDPMMYIYILYIVYWLLGTRILSTKSAYIYINVLSLDILGDWLFFYQSKETSETLFLCETSKGIIIYIY